MDGINNSVWNWNISQNYAKMIHITKLYTHVSLHCDIKWLELKKYHLSQTYSR